VYICRPSHPNVSLQKSCPQRQQNLYRFVVCHVGYGSVLLVKNSATMISVGMLFLQSVIWHLVEPKPSQVWISISSSVLAEKLMYRNVFFSHITIYLSVELVTNWSYFKPIFPLLIHYFDSKWIYFGIDNTSPVASHALISVPMVWSLCLYGILGDKGLHSQPMARYQCKSETNWYPPLVSNWISVILHSS